MAQIADPLPAGPTSAAELAAFERYIGHALPPDYRAFLLQHNGGHPDPDAFLIDTTGTGEQEDIVMCLFPMRDLSVGVVEVESPDGLRTWPLHCAWDDLQTDLADPDIYGEAGITEPLLPVGTDGSSNYFCVVLGGDRTGSVVFFDHETGETHLLGSSFDAFLGHLRPRTRTDYAF